MNIELREGWIWPTSDKRCWDYMQRFPDLPQRIKHHASGFRSMVQAGGNAGFYTKQYARMFDSVYTFEPDNLNFKCLCMNVPETNVVKMQACLGNERQQVNLNIIEENRGKNYIDGKGIYPILRIDDLNLPDCDLIHLDIEGYEYNALLGGIETIKKSNPTIVVEMWDQLTNRFGTDMNDKVKSLMNELGYSNACVLDDSDWVFVK